MVLVLSAVLCLTLYSFVRKLSYLKSRLQSSETLLPMCLTIAACIARVWKTDSDADVSESDQTSRTLETKEAALKSSVLNLFKELENSHYRATWLTVYSETGEVWADSFSPCRGKLPVPPTRSQRSALEAVRSAGLFTSATPSLGVLTQIFTRHAPARGNQTVSIAAVRAPHGAPFVVLMQSCGPESE